MVEAGQLLIGFYYIMKRKKDPADAFHTPPGHG